jgi:hypothetical protein
MGNMVYRLAILFVFGAASVLGAPRADARPPERFLFMGDGTLRIKSTKNKHRFRGSAASSRSAASAA